MKKHAISLVILFVITLTLCGSVSADSVSGTTISSQSDMNTTDLSSNRHIFINVSNDEGVKYNNDSAYYIGPNGTYYIKADGGGLNELHIAYTNSTDYNSTTGKYLNYGEVTVVNSTSVSSSGVFYLTNTGGRGFTDDIILLLSVKGPISDDFSVTIISNGYTWTLPAVGGAYQPSTPTDYHYITGVNETFTKSDFQYGPQVYKPGPGALGTWSLPLYYGQDTSDNSTEEYLMFIDLYVGNIKSSSVAGLINNGAVKVQYIFNNLTTTASFNIYGWTLASNQGEGISWTNKVALGDAQSSGYTVNYNPVTPVAAFSANTTSGNSPLNVQFTDTSSNYPTSWIWDFGDGSSTSTEQNPTHTYTTPGNYTVTLTAINAAGNSTYTMNITVLDVTAPTVSASPVGGSFNTTQTVTLNTTDDSGSATTYYTTDGTNPKTSTTRSVYNGPITINGTTTLLFAAVDAASNWSPVYNETYTIDRTIPTAASSVKNGTYNTNKVVTLSMSEKGTIYYTTDGTTPTTNSKKYTGPITISKTTTLRYIAVDLAGNTSPVYTNKYAIDKTALKVTSTNPTSNKNKVSRKSSIIINFNKKIKLLNKYWWSKIVVKNQYGKVIPISKYISGNKLIIKTNTKQAYTHYTITIPAAAISDYAGNKLKKAYKLTFETGK